MAQQLDLLAIHPDDSTYTIAQQYSDSVHQKAHVQHRWGAGDKRYSFPTMMIDFGLGRASDHIMGNSQCWNYSIGLGYNLLQFSTYHPARPAFFGGAITLGVNGLVQPEQGYAYDTYLADRDVILPNNGGESVHGTLIVQYNSKYVRQMAWRVQGSIAVPLAFTVRINNQDTHQLTVGCEPEIALGVMYPWCTGMYDMTASCTFTLRGIIQYKYQNFYVSFRPAMSHESFYTYSGRRTHVRVGIGWHF